MAVADVIDDLLKVVGPWLKARRDSRSRGLLLGQQGAPPSEQQAGVQTVPARHLRGGRGWTVRLGQDNALLLGRQDAARARNDDVRRVSHRSRHRAETAPSDASNISSTKHYRHKATFTKRLRLEAFADPRSIPRIFLTHKHTPTRGSLLLDDLGCGHGPRGSDVGLWRPLGLMFDSTFMAIETHSLSVP